MVSLWLTGRFYREFQAAEQPPESRQGLVRVAGLEPARAKLRGF